MTKFNVGDRVRISENARVSNNDVTPEDYRFLVNLAKMLGVSLPEDDIGKEGNITDIDELGAFIKLDGEDKPYWFAFPWFEKIEKTITKRENDISIYRDKRGFIVVTDGAKTVEVTEDDYKIGTLKGLIKFFHTPENKENDNELSKLIHNFL